MIISRIFVEHQEPNAQPSDTGLSNVQRIEIVTGTGTKYIITPESGRLRISKQGDSRIRPISVSPIAGNEVHLD